MTGRLWRLCPAVEPRSRASGIDTRRGPQVLSKVQQHVDDGVPDLARRLQWARMVAIAPDLPDAGDALDGQRDADDEASNAFCQRMVAVCLDDRVHVVLLNRKVQDAKHRVA